MSELEAVIAATIEAELARIAQTLPPGEYRVDVDGPGTDQVNTTTLVVD